jgi:hypothetical protein
MKIKLETATTIPAGVALKLTPEQYASRSHLLELLDGEKEVYVGVVPHQFKAGETVEIAGDLPKGVLPVYDWHRGELTEEEINRFEEETEQHTQKSAHKKPKKPVNEDGENNG